jgi:hypothetical protein
MFGAPAQPQQQQPVPNQWMSNGKILQLHFLVREIFYCQFVEKYLF